MADRVEQIIQDLVPSFAGEHPDWRDVVSRVSGPHGRRTLWRRRPGTLLAAALLVVLVALFATPALGLQGLVLGLFRKDVSFANSRSAPNLVKKNFEDLGIAGLRRWSPEVLAAQARVVATFSINGHPRQLYVALTRRGGYCYAFEDNFGGCRQTNADREIGTNGQLSLTWQQGVGFISQGRARDTIMSARPVTRVLGDITAPSAVKLTISYADDETDAIPFVWVSKPIAAGFFSYDIPTSHQTKETRVVAVTLYGADAHVLARRTFTYVQSHPHPLPRPRPPSRLITPKPRLLPAHPQVAPSAPLQRGSADGFAVVAGHNGSVQFTEAHQTALLKRLVGHNVEYSCFRLTTEFGIFTVRGNGDDGQFASSVGINPRIGAPFDGCEIDDGFGHRWPDQLGDHAAVEIAFTAAGRHYFANRAAARDLALFVRSGRMHKLRKEPTPQALKAIHAAYGGELAHSRIRIAVPNRHSLRFSETSPTGRRFQVTVTNGRISSQNLKPLAFVF